ncbi:glycosyltransferase family 2 protein [Bizionia sp. KMM 8389]
MDLQKLLPSYSVQPNTTYEYRFTVFTPVYNRSGTLERVFNSLEFQTYKNFELVIINDGSTDNSHEVIEALIAKASFRVNYINNTHNKHKMACYFQAIQIAKGEFILPFDSDDACIPKALEVLNAEYESIPDNLKTKISGVTCMCEDQNGNLIGHPFTTQPFYSNTFLSQRKHVESNEKWGFTKTSILRGIQINPDVFNKGYIPEGIIWELISKEGFQTKYINQVLRIYYLDTENAISIQNHKNDAFGMAIYSLSILNWFFKPYFFKYPGLFIKRILTLLRAAYFLNFNLKTYIQSIKPFLLKVIFVIGWPFKFLLKNS